MPFALHCGELIWNCTYERSELQAERDEVLDHRQVLGDGDEGGRVRVGSAREGAEAEVEPGTAGGEEGETLNFCKEVKMVKHVILWKLKDDVVDKAAVKRGIKEGLEGLLGKVPGLVDITVRIEGLASSNADAMLDTTFENEAALKGYVTHPAHVAVADAKVRPFTQIRLCLDYIC